MASSTTIPTIAAGETGFQLKMSWIDDNEKEYTSTFRTKATPSDAEIQAIVTAAQAGSNASSWRMEKNTIWEGDKDAANAESAVHELVSSKIRLSLKNISSGGYARAYLPAPLEILVGDNNIVDITQGLYTAWRDAISAVKATGYALSNVAFVTYSKRNDSTSP